MTAAPLAPLCSRLRVQRCADTFFIASAAGAQAGGVTATQGTDVSHRGGDRGFVEVAAGAAQLRWPDYRGNDFFMTLGNIAASGHASLMFVDYETGAMLRTEGTARSAAVPPSPAHTGCVMPDLHFVWCGV